MSKKIIADNGISRIESFDLLAMSPTEAVEALPPAGTKMLMRVMVGPRNQEGKRPFDGTWRVVDFEWLIRDTEASLRPHLPPGDATPEPLTLPWFARTILTEIAELRSFISKGGNADPQVGIALGWHLGDMIRDAQRHINDGDHIRTGVTTRKGRRKGGQKTGAHTKTTAADNRQRIARAYAQWQSSDDLRDDHPVATRYIADIVGLSLRTVQNHLKKRNASS